MPFHYVRMGIMEYISKSVEETNQIATNFAKATLVKKDFGATVIGLSGELGAGKTTFMKAFAEALGVGGVIQSPTFVIMKIYKLKGASKKLQEEKNFKLAPCAFKLLIHIDAYRLETGEDLKKLGWDQIVSDKNNIICIEWPEKVGDILTPDIMIRFEHGKAGENQRKISIA